MAATEIIRAESPYYTTHEAAAYLKLSPPTTVVRIPGNWTPLTPSSCKP